MFYPIPLFDHAEREATAVDDFTVKFNYIEYERPVHIDTITVSNQDTDAKVAHVGVMSAGQAYYLETLTLTTATYFYKSKLNIMLPIDYSVVVKLVSPTVGDRYYINVCGGVR